MYEEKKEKIKDILQEIEKYWRANPELKFNQLLIKLRLIPDGGHWSVSDEYIKETLKNNPNEIKRKQML